MDKRNATLKIALAQMTVTHGEVAPNLATICHMTAEAAQAGAQIVCFPELAQCGFYMKKETLNALAEPIEGPFVTKLQALAAEHHIHLLCGYAEAPTGEEALYNSCVLIDDEGKILENMRKIYLWGREKQRFTPGHRLPVVNTKLGRIGILNCYDAEYPETFRIEALKGAELILVGANWSFTGQSRWELQLSCNALCNLLFVAGVNIADQYCCGHSRVVAPDGRVIETVHNEETVLVTTIDFAEIEEQRAKIPYMTDFNPETFTMDALKTY